MLSYTVGADSFRLWTYT